MSDGIPNPSSKDLGSQKARARTGRRWPWRLIAVITVGALLIGLNVWRNQRGPQVATEIFLGITYGCNRLETSPEGSGLLHWVRVDLTAPGIELFVTPLDPSAVAQGWQYHLRRPKDVLQEEDLAVVINGSLFTSNSGWFYRSGDLARSVETVVANHKVSHFWEHTYLLWFDDQLTPHLKPSKPPTEAELAQAMWGIGGQGVGLRDSQVWSGNSAVPNSRTAVAIDARRKLLFLAVGESISPRLLLRSLFDLGAKDGMLLDGGTSSSMVIGQGAKGIRPGVLIDGWRPVATCFGVRARRLQGMN
jgi:Phosphodiester glycosidase